MDHVQQVWFQPDRALHVPGVRRNRAAPSRRALAEHPIWSTLHAVDTLERGDIQFFFQPSVQPADAETYVLGVQSFFAILSPSRGSHRRLRVGRKRMPASARDRFWARIERVGSLQRVLGDKLEPERYSTKTRGERYQPAARPIARGTYAFVQHDDHTHLVYEVEPFGFDDAPEEIQLAPSGDHLVLFKNRTSSSAVWSHAGALSTLGDEGTQLVLVGARAGDRIADAA